MFHPFELTSAEMWSYLHYLLIGLMIAANIFGLYLASNSFAPLARRVRRPIGWLAGASFSIYLFHAPFMAFLVALSPWPVAAWPTRALLFIGIPLTILALAEITERRKDVWRDGLIKVAGNLGLALRS
jgi:peptidoglycan/LPS O-acetylase OafA/YrhL